MNEPDSSTEQLPGTQARNARASRSASPMTTDEDLLEGVDLGPVDKMETVVEDPEPEEHLTPDPKRQGKKKTARRRGERIRAGAAGSHAQTAHERPII